MKNTKQSSKDKKISRKEAMKKLGYTALSATTMLILLNKPDNARAQPGSEELPPIWEW